MNSFECFKIVLIVTENTKNSDEEFVGLFRDAKTIYELYVSDKIRCKYHPYFNYRSILENYYPLEIIEKFQKKVRKDDSLYNSLLKPLVKEGLLQGNMSELNLTQKEISSELDNKEYEAVDEYMKKLGILHQMITPLADEAYECINGIRKRWK